MALSNPYQKYQQNSVTSATPEELTHMLYSAGVRYIRQGIMHIQENNMQKAHETLIKAQEIYIHLQATLNKDIEISANLDRLYDFIIRHLMQANIKKDTAMLADVVGLAEELRDTWKEAMDRARGR
ncbi:flagellar export chaperone FliS [Desulfallas thermosapovorans]|uniref:Flagellar protein FliS n=1 Tax=Desulfallas thermosapovorans DSM 6562 TaxID=1121431 RepID=A0A5S4ZTH5_9FIRM|nr:flagellar export chaperone FliS [Desulfallas thermosapovorans]TYO95493.1 flagellar protein FliS [Desulfallas thermosapovorans DSM 6562]